MPYWTTPYNAAGGPTASQIVHPLSAFWDTVIIFSAVAAYGFATVAMKTRNRVWCLAWMLLAAALGALFLSRASTSFAAMVSAGNSPERSGYLSIYFILVAVHAIHVLVGLLWMAVMMIQVALMEWSEKLVTRMLLLRLYWTLQASVWVCIFAFVVLRGAA